MKSCGERRLLALSLEKTSFWELSCWDFVGKEERGSLFFCCPLNNGKTEETKVDLVKVAPGAKNYWKILALNNPFPTYKYYFFSNFIIHSNYLFSLPDHVSSTLDLSKALNRLGERALSRDNSGGDCEILSEEEEELGAAFQKFSVLTRELSGLMRDAMASLDGSLLFPTDRWVVLLFFRRFPYF